MIANREQQQKIVLNTYKVMDKGLQEEAFTYMLEDLNDTQLDVLFEYLAYCDTTNWNKAYDEVMEKGEEE